MVGEAGGEYQFSTRQWEQALGYIEAHPEIRDVLLSGGDPLTIADEKLDYLLGRLRRIKHVQVIRLGTQVPTGFAKAITRGQTRMLRTQQPRRKDITVHRPPRPVTGRAGRSPRRAE